MLHDWEKRIMTINEIVRQARSEGVLWSLAVKAEIMKEFLRALTVSEFGQELVLQGGGALKFVYDSPRYSVDIDFVLRTPARALTHFFELGRILPRVFEHPLAAVAKPVGDNMLRLSLILKMENREVLSTKIEICSVTSETAHSEPSEVGEVLVESPAEIIIDKLAANLDRLQRKNYVKTHDVFDVFYLINKFPSPEVKGVDVQRKLQDYKAPFSPAAVQALLCWFEQEQHFDEFRKALEGFVPERDLRNLDLPNTFQTVKNFVKQVFEL